MNNYDDDGMGWDWDCDMGPRDGPGPMFPPLRGNFGGRDERYSNAYGDYRGGYGPGGGFGPPSFGPSSFGPPPPFGPRPNFPPVPPPLLMGRGFGPDGPPVRKNLLEDRVIRYLSRCGVGKEHLKNLPRDLLKQIEPEYCGLCGHSFDNFAMSRLHYVSKNHLKNQKKWINQQSDAGYHSLGPREVPLKSRDLYCELCDVHITSKVHAESHYAGRPHRSIVEGRKNPKNPFLLQKGMQSRVEQLIRREKRNLKPLENEEEPESLKEATPFQPELYCDICKTSVTCTEQMTMHLNGKRHLSKEKHHILTMMKGGNKEAKDSEEQGEEVEDEEEEAAEGVTDENKETADDWENGDGNWEDNPAPQKQKYSVSAEEF